MRSVAKVHQCCCVIVYPGSRNRCSAMVEGQDVPFCPGCEKRHEGMTIDGGGKVEAEF